MNNNIPLPPPPLPRPLPPRIGNNIRNLRPNGNQPHRQEHPELLPLDILLKLKPRSMLRYLSRQVAVGLTQSFALFFLLYPYLSDFILSIKRSGLFLVFSASLDHLLNIRNTIILFLAMCILLVTLILQVLQFPLRLVLIYFIHTYSKIASRKLLSRLGSAFIRGKFWSINQTAGSIGLGLAVAGAVSVFLLRYPKLDLATRGCKNPIISTTQSISIYENPFLWFIRIFSPTTEEVSDGCNPYEIQMTQDIDIAYRLTIISTLIIIARLIFSLVSFWCSFFSEDSDDWSEFVAEKIVVSEWTGSENNSETNIQENTTTTTTSDESDEATCSICIAPFSIGEKIGKLPCNHIFHQDCVFPWLRRQQQSFTCPLCTRSIDTDDED
jgi:Ring finger domain